MARKFKVRYSVNLHGDYEIEANSEEEAVAMIKEDFENLEYRNLLEMDKSDEKFTVIK